MTIYQQIKFSLRLIVRPIQGFSDLKYEQKATLSLANMLLLLLVVVNILQSKYAGFLVNYNDPRQLSSIDELQNVVLPFILWCVSNWSLTTLMDGEGKFKEIWMATSYAMTPLIIIYTITAIFSNFLTGPEVAFYYALNSFAWVWFLLLMFIGMMVVHQYSIGKTLVTAFLTIVVMLIILFLGLLVFSLIQQLTTFVTTIYREILLWK